MSDPGAEGARVDLVDLWGRLAKLEDNSLEAAERDELMALLDQSRAARRLYREFFADSAGLDLVAEVLDEQGRLPVLEDALRPWRIFRNSVLVAAAVLAIGAVVAALIMIKPAEPEVMVVAVSADTRWEVDGLVEDPGATEWAVVEGSTVQVWSGTVRLRLESGAEMVMQGPARVHFPELDKPVLQKGWLWIDSGTSGERFEVSTPDLLIRNVGTRFGIRVPADGPAEVHLIAGKLEVLAKSTREAVASLEPGKKGKAIPPASPPTDVTRARDPFPGLEELMTARASYPTTVQGQNPVGYWRMNGSAPGLIANEIPDGLVGKRHPQLSLSGPGPEPADGFHGFGRGNTCARLPVDPDEAPVRFGEVPVYRGDAYRDDFSTPQDYAGGTNGTIWHGVANAGNAVSLASGDLVPGRLRIQAADSVGWEAGKANAPFLYMNVSGDFDARVQVSAQTRGEYNVGALMARLAAPSANGRPGEDYISLNSNGFGGSSISTRILHDGSQNDSGGANATAYPRVLRLTRTGNIFRAYISVDGSEWSVVNWGGVRGRRIGAELVREDLEGLPLQVGLWQGAFSYSGHTVDFDDFSIRMASGNSREDSGASDPISAPLNGREGTVSLWIRREHRDDLKELVWTAGRGSKDNAMQVGIGPDGRPEFFIEDGRYDVLIASTERIDDGDWHHLAACWSPSAVDLYVDGRRVASDTELRSKLGGVLPELRFGADPGTSEAVSFSGWIDEVALWDRSLTAAEIKHQYESAGGE